MFSPIVTMVFHGRLVVGRGQLGCTPRLQRNPLQR